MKTKDGSILDQDVHLLTKAVVTKQSYLRYMRIYDVLNSTETGKLNLSQIINAISAGFGVPDLIDLMLSVGLVSNDENELNEEIKALLIASSDNGKLRHPAEMIQVQGVWILKQDADYIGSTLKNLAPLATSLLQMPFRMQESDRNMLIHIGLLDESGCMPTVVQLMMQRYIDGQL